MTLRAMTDAATLNEVLQAQAESRPDVRWLTLLERSGKEHHLTYGNLYEQSQSVAAALGDAGVSKGDRVVIILPTCMEYFFVFWGVLLAGGIPVPLYPPFRPNEFDRYGSQLLAILNNCGASAVVTDGILYRILKRMVRPVSGSISLLLANRLIGSGVRPMSRGLPDSRDTALIQYTSGSTGVPKGVELTHYGLLANIRAVDSVLKYRPDDVGVSWLPLYHDMGLIGAVLGTLHHSIPLILMPPQDFIRDPKRWLYAIHRYHGTLSAAPNFAFSLCNRKIKDHEIKGLDLTGWRVAINGAEQIHPGTMREFIRKFGPYGFSKKACMPAYGLAECSLAVTFSDLEEELVISSYHRKSLEVEGKAIPMPEADPESVKWVSVGRAIPGHEVRVVDPDHGPERGDLPVEVPDRTIGEVMIHGPSLMKGYYRQPGITAEALRDGWFCSGDLGFMDGNRLFITGRSKDLIIKGGRNYHPQDIEAAASSVDGVRPGCVCAFGVPHIEQGTEEIVLLAETRARSAKKQRSVLREIKKTVQRDAGCSPDQIILVPPGYVAKTSSGKIQRYLCRDRFLAGEFRNARRAWVPEWVGSVFRFFFCRGGG
jgi:fatty-acyl-CoA synthase